MGITIVQKSDLSVRKKNPKIALVLAGGAVTGGAFKLGGLKALDDFLVNRRRPTSTSTSASRAGALLAAPLAGGVSPAEMLKSLEGKSTSSPLPRRATSTSPNLRRVRRAAARSSRCDLLTFLPGHGRRPAARRCPSWPRELQRAAGRRAGASRAPRSLQRAAGADRRRDRPAARGFPFPLDYLPSGFFDNSSIERYLRRNLERARHDQRLPRRSTGAPSASSTSSR